MPGGNGMGPMGQGPLTGRGQGQCGSGTAQRRGTGAAAGWCGGGFGRGRGGRGGGFRNRFFAAGQPLPAAPVQDDPEFLQQQIDVLQQRLQAVRGAGNAQQ